MCGGSCSCESRSSSSGARWRSWLSPCRLLPGGQPLLPLLLLLLLLLPSLLPCTHSGMLPRTWDGCRRRMRISSSRQRRQRRRAWRQRKKRRGLLTWMRIACQAQT